MEVTVPAVLAAVLALGGCTSAAAEQPAALPATLAATGIAGPNVRPFAPQYPLWSDGATKRRWIYLPAAIEAGWQLPVGTKLWKELSFGGRRTETRYMERTAAGWRFATYAWPADGGDAALVAPRGAHTDVAIAEGHTHAIPSEADCRACHGNAASPVLGFTALQLSADRDPRAPHAEPRPIGALDLPALIAAGLVPAQDAAPRIVARTADERAALGYLAANCGGCHRADGPLASIGMDLAAEPIATTLARPSHFVTAAATTRIVAGDPDASVVVQRMQSRNPTTQMPPLGTQIVDAEATALVSRWITQLTGD